MALLRRSREDGQAPLESDAPGLAAALEQAPKTSVNILTTRSGQPWGTGFKASWRRQLSIAGLEPLDSARKVFQGLRKSAVVFLLEAGCTDAEASAITGQTLEMLEQHAREVNQRRLAAAAILKWEAAPERKSEKSS